MALLIIPVLKRWSRARGPYGYSFTLLLFYSFTLLLFYSFTLLLFYSFTLLLFYSFTLLLFYSFTLLLFYSFTLLASNTILPLNKHDALPTELTDHSIQTENKLTIFIQWLYPSYLKRESNRNKKWYLVRISLEHWTLPLLAPCSTNWANRPFDTKREQINNFYTMIVPKLLKKRK